MALMLFVTEVLKYTYIYIEYCNLYLVCTHSAILKMYIIMPEKKNLFIILSDLILG